MLKRICELVRQRKRRLYAGDWWATGEQFREFCESRGPQPPNYWEGNDWGACKCKRCGHVDHTGEVCHCLCRHPWPQLTEEGIEKYVSTSSSCCDIGGGRLMGAMTFWGNVSPWLFHPLRTLAAAIAFRYFDNHPDLEIRFKAHVTKECTCNCDNGKGNGYPCDVHGEPAEDEHP